VRRYDEPVQVRLGSDGRPDAFLWRRRLYVVREVLSTWLEREAWWETVGTYEPGRSYERTIWRVEAGHGRSWGTGVYDLAQAVGLPAMAGAGAGAAGAAGSPGAPAAEQEQSGWWLLCHLD
jgi:hypothetical protein